MVLDESNIKKVLGIKCRKVLTLPFYFIKPESLKRQNWKKRKKIKKIYCSFWEEDAGRFLLPLSTSSILKALKDRIGRREKNIKKYIVEIRIEKKDIVLGEGWVGIEILNVRVRVEILNVRVRVGGLRCG